MLVSGQTPHGCTRQLSTTPTGRYSPPYGDAMKYKVILPVINDLPALTTVAASVDAPDSEQALKLAMSAAVALGWDLDNDRAASVEYPDLWTISTRTCKSYCGACT